MKTYCARHFATRCITSATQAAIGLCLLSLLAGCSKNSGGGTQAAAARSPAHPAMRTAPAVSGSPARQGTLPQGHPPIDGRSQPPAPPPMQGGGSTASSGGAISADELNAQLARFGMSVEFPEEWKLERGSSMRLATVRLPRADGSADGEMSIIPARGSVDANVRRWEGQFSEKPTARISTQTVGALEVTTVEIDGTFTSGGPMMGGGAPAAGTKLLGAIVQPAGRPEMVFFKAWGPSATMEKWRAGFETFVQSIRPN